MKPHRPRVSRGRAVRLGLLAALGLAALACAAGRRPPPLHRGPEASVRLEVVVTGLRGTQGMLRGALFATAAGFPMEHERALLRAEAPARDGALLVFENVPSGEYAVAVLHDADVDGRMARNALGMPREGYAFSGRVVGLPRFDAALVRLLPPLARLELRLVYGWP